MILQYIRIGPPLLSRAKLLGFDSGAPKHIQKDRILTTRKANWWAFAFGCPAQQAAGHRAVNMGRLYPQKRGRLPGP